MGWREGTYVGGRERGREEGMKGGSNKRREGKEDRRTNLIYNYRRQ